MKLEVGKKYKDRSGYTWKIVHKYRKSAWNYHRFVGVSQQVGVPIVFRENGCTASLDDLKFRLDYRSTSGPNEGGTE